MFAIDSSERQKLRRLQQSAPDMEGIIKNLLEFQGQDYDEKSKKLLFLIISYVN